MLKKASRLQPYCWYSIVSIVFVLSISEHLERFVSADTKVRVTTVGTIAVEKVLARIFTAQNTTLCPEYKTTHLNAPSASIIQSNGSDWSRLGRGIQSTLAGTVFLSNSLHGNTTPI